MGGRWAWGVSPGVPVRGLLTAYLPFWLKGVLESAKWDLWYRDWCHEVRSTQIRFMAVPLRGPKHLARSLAQQH